MFFPFDTEEKSNETSSDEGGIDFFSMIPAAPKELEIINDGEEDEVLEEYLNEVNSDISKKLISANTVH